MKRVTPIALSGLVTLCALVPRPASAQSHQRRILRPIVDAGAVHAPVVTPVATPTVATPAPVVDAGAVADAGVKEKGKEGAEQKKRRVDYVDRVRKEVRAIVPAHQLTEADRELVRTHWRRSMRALRVRLLAEDSNDAASVARCDALLAKLDQLLLGKLKALHTKAAPAGAK
jgi:hypothetical protein